MRYSWECKECEHVTIVNRKVADIEIPPDNGCEKCQATDLKRIITFADRKGLQGFILERGSTPGWHFEQYTKTRPIQ